jgi:hypothetical protein
MRWMESQSLLLKFDNDEIRNWANSSTMPIRFCQERCPRRAAPKSAREAAIVLWGNLCAVFGHFVCALLHPALGDLDNHLYRQFWRSYCKPCHFESIL